MCWSELDTERGTWTLPSEAIKKRKRAHTLPLPQMKRRLDIIDKCAAPGHT